jgi:hypothetical protein
MNRHAAPSHLWLMATDSLIFASAASGLPARSSVRFLLRMEGAVVAVVAAAAYAHLGASWWWFAACWLLPDLSILGYLAGPCWGARCYNAIHSYVLPAVLAGSALAFNAHGLLPAALIWTNHIGVDRTLGYGLKYVNGFGWTHLGGVGKVAKPAQE